MRNVTGRGATAYNLRWPETPEFTSVAAKLAGNAIDRMLEIVWKGYVSFKTEFLEQIDIAAADEEIERTITQELEPHIRNCLTGDEVYDIQHGRYEPETRAPAPAQPPAYDMAFFLKTNGRIMWPLEAKVLRTPANVAPYVNDIVNEFLTGRYAPFTNSAGMLGYLLSGKAEEAPANIENRLGVKLIAHPTLHPLFNHHVSDHDRRLENENWASGQFACHHLIMSMHKENSSK